ncbi:hypothetical protein GIB67_024013, partial [Kingdonia uniflora]
GTKGNRFCMPNARVMIHQPQSICCLTGEHTLHIYLWTGALLMGYTKIRRFANLRKSNTNPPPLLPSSPQRGDLPLGRNMEDAILDFSYKEYAESPPRLREESSWVQNPPIKKTKECGHSSLGTVFHFEPCSSSKTRDVIIVTEENPKKKNKKLVLPYLHDHVMYSILNRLTAHSLYHHCKQWLPITSNPVFIHHHLHTSPLGLITAKYINNNTTSLFQFMEFDGLHFKLQDLATLPVLFNVVSSCNGLAVIEQRQLDETQSTATYVINPITMQKIQPPWDVLRKVGISTCWIELVFFPSTNEYKIVISLWDEHTNYSFLCIWTLGGGRDNLWREIDGSQVWFKYMGNRILVDGVLYWDFFHGLLAIDLSNEKAQLLQLPNQLSSGLKSMLKMEGCLSFVSYCNPQKADIWMLKKNNSSSSPTKDEGEEWVIVFSIVPPVGQMRREILRYLLSVLGCVNNGQVIIFRKLNDCKHQCGSLCVYDVNTKKWREIENDKDFSEYKVVHCNSLVSLQKS